MLNKIGLKAEPRIIGAETYFATVGDRKTNAATGFDDWFQDFPHPADFLFLIEGGSIQPTNNQNHSLIDDPKVDKLVERSRRRRQTEPPSRSAELDKYLTGPRRYIAPVRAHEGHHVRLRTDGLRELHGVSPRLSQRLVTVLPQVGADRDRTASAPSRRGGLSRSSTGRMATDPATELQLPGARRPARRGEREVSAGVSPWRLGAPAPRPQQGGLAFGVLFLVMVAVCLAAPLWANHVAKTGPDENHITDQITIDGKKKDVVVASRACRSARPGRAKFFLGADTNGRDIMVRLLYGGRNSLLIGVARRSVHASALGGARPRGRLLPGLDRLRDRPRARRHLGVPGGAPGRGARHGAGARRPEARADQDRRATRSGSRSS